MAKKTTDYNKMREVVKDYHRFSFRKRKNENYTPQQKSAISRAYFRLSDYINQVQSNRASFIRGPRSRIRKLDGIKTNKGLFYKYPGARLVKAKIGKGKRKIYVIRTKYKQRREIFFPFPRNILHDIQRIIIYVERLVSLYKPDYILWSVNGFRGGTPYIPEQFFLYATEEKDPDGKISDALMRDNGGFFNGVFFGFFPERKLKGF